MSHHQTGEKNGRFENLTGQEFGRWRVLRPVGSRGGQWLWECVCACGTERTISTHDLRKRDGTRSCGCSRRTDVDRSLWLKLRKNHVTGCWEWPGAKTEFGYGKVGFGGKVYDTHRLAYELCVGDVPDGLFVLHRCDNPPCCNPTHLYAGTPTQNMLDRLVRGRQKTKLTPEQAAEIKRIGEAREMSAAAAGRKFGVSDTMVLNIWKGSSWAHV